MKLIGSNVEEAYRKELERGSNAFLGDNRNSNLYKILKKKRGYVNSAYFLNGYQLGDYENGTILLNNDVIVFYEITDGNLESFDMVSIESYKRGLKKHGMIKLLIALDLG